MELADPALVRKQHFEGRPQQVLHIQPQCRIHHVVGAQHLSGPAALVALRRKMAAGRDIPHQVALAQEHDSHQLRVVLDPADLDIRQQEDTPVERGIQPVVVDIHLVELLGLGIQVEQEDNLVLRAAIQCQQLASLSYKVTVFHLRSV